MLPLCLPHCPCELPVSLAVQPGGKQRARPVNGHGGQLPWGEPVVDQFRPAVGPQCRGDIPAQQFEIAQVVGGDRGRQSKPVPAGDLHGTAQVAPGGAWPASGQVHKGTVGQRLGEILRLGLLSQQGDSRVVLVERRTISAGTAQQQAALAVQYAALSGRDQRLGLVEQPEP